MSVSVAIRRRNSEEMVLPATMDPTGPLDNTMGALYIATVVSAVLYGLCLLQAFLYFQSHKRDQWYIKAAVITVVVFDGIQLSMIAAGVYHYVIRNFHNPSKLQYLFWPLSVEALFVGGNALIVQVFYTYRVWRLSKRNWVLCTFILLLVCGELGTGVAWVILSLELKTFIDLLTLSPLAITIHVFSCSIDIIIAGSLCFLLHRSKTGFKRTDSIIKKLILFVISTGLLTTIFAILAFITLLSAPYGLIYGIFYFCLGRLYTNSFLTTLNARSTINEETELKPTSHSTTPKESTVSSRIKNINIRIETTQEAIRDEEKVLSDSMATTRKGRMDSDDILAPKSYLLVQ